MAFPEPRPQGDKLVGKILRIDKFGNILTNFRPQHLRGDFTIRIQGLDITSYHSTFGDAGPGEFFAFEGSSGFVEIALNRGSAAAKLKVARGAEIEVESDYANQ